MFDAIKSPPKPGEKLTVNTSRGGKKGEEEEEERKERKKKKKKDVLGRR